MSSSVIQLRCPNPLTSGTNNWLRGERYYNQFKCDYNGKVANQTTAAKAVYDYYGKWDKRFSLTSNYGWQQKSYFMKDQLLVQLVN